MLKKNSDTHKINAVDLSSVEYCSSKLVTVYFVKHP